MKSVDLFAGAGGLSCGLKQSGFTPVLANELVPQFAETYQLNHQDAQVIVGDVRQVCEANLKKLLGVAEDEIDLIAGGPPCQGFSINAPIRTLDDERNHLFKDSLRIMLKAFLETGELGNILHCSGGAGSFKLRRGARPYVEFAAIWLKHLPAYNRIAIHSLNQVIQRVALPYMETRVL